MNLHPTAYVHPEARLAEDVEIGPFSVIGPDVEIGPGTVVSSCVRIVGHVKMGKGNRIFHGAVIGEEPQDLNFKGERSFVRIGDNNTIREYATVHRATGEGEETVIGNDNLLMAYSHLGHNVRVGNGCVIVNAAQIGGHAVIEDSAYISAYSPVHQFVRIGKLAIVGGSTRVNQDVPPFMMALGYEAEILGVNRVGLRRHGFSSERIDALAEAYKVLYRQGHATETALEKLRREFPDNPDIRYLVDFFGASKRGIIKKARRSARK